ncbi:TetR/AcrR family transcriptional regulator [uncultured Jatrophihabitans sp.]|uniref:TetR/AcrR family transcriptional regulator n=1 Tax=uncultured Jatrophihabitans sp. TaxID=1610747 RepID=UPI0035CAD5D7
MTAPTARAQAREQMTEQIKATAREHLAGDGPNLSLRAVARDLGVVSSAVYRYFASRDDLLTALILDAYNELGLAVDEAQAALPPRDIAGRWAAICRATRQWALEHPHEYALLYGSPAPGYAAPQDTVAPAQRPVLVALGVLADAVDRGVVTPPSDRLPRLVRADLESIRRLSGDDIPATLLARLLSVWAQLHGTISFELFGRWPHAIDACDDFFELQIRMMARHLGIG